MATKVRLTGVQAMQRKLAAISDRFGDRAAGALFRFAERRVATPAKQQYVPVDFGVLKGEIIVFAPQRRGFTISVTIAAGTGASAPYALAIHEHPSKYSPPSWRGTTVTFHPSGRGPKYLEKPLMAAVASAAQELAADLVLK